jgi:hypothetical protein
MAVGIDGPTIYVAEREMLSLPQSFNHRLAPFLFAEHALMASSKGKHKKCIVAVILNGLCFFRPTGVARYKICEYMSAYNIVSIKCGEGKRRDVYSTFRQFYFICDHADQACSWIIAAREVLFAGVLDPKPIKLLAFGQPIARYSALFCARTDTLAQLRYVAVCHRYAVEPTEDFIELFRVINPMRSTTVTLEGSMDGPANLRCLTIPVSQIDRIAVIHFRGFAPYACCRAAHDILKQSTSVRTVIFENYSFLIPNQFKMDRLTAVRHPISILFLQCPLPPQMSADVVTELCKFPGEYQRLHFSGFNLNAAACREIFTAIENARCMRTVEMMAFDDIEASTVSMERSLLGIASVIRRCRFLRSVSFSGSAPPLSIQPEMFTNSNVLHVIHLVRQDMSHTLSDFVVPPQVHLLNFSQCNFTSTSFNQLFTRLARAKKPLVLELADLQIPASHWQAIWASLPTYPKLVCLRGLDWSGNPMPTSAIPTFVDFFFSTNRIRFLKIDRIYRTSSLHDLDNFLSGIPKDTLWGISIGGSRDYNFSGNFRFLMRALPTLHNLHMLHIDGQRLTERDIEPMMDYLHGHRQSLVEVSCDETALTTPDRFYAFYEMIEALDLRAVGRPYSDLVRLFQKPVANMPVRFETFRTAIQRRMPATSQTIRSHYMCRTNTTGAFDADELYGFAARYPTYGTITQKDIWCLAPVQSGQEMPTLCLLTLQEEFECLAALHIKLLVPPMSLPRFPPPPELAIADEFVQEADAYIGKKFRDREARDLPSAGPILGLVSGQPGVERMGRTPPASTTDLPSAQSRRQAKAWKRNGIVPPREPSEPDSLPFRSTSPPPESPPPKSAPRLGTSGEPPLDAPPSPKAAALSLEGAPPRKTGHRARRSAARLQDRPSRKTAALPPQEPIFKDPVALPANAAALHQKPQIGNIRLSDLPALGLVPPPPDDNGLILGRLDRSELPSPGFRPLPPSDEEDDDGADGRIQRLDPSELPAMGFVPPPPPDEDDKDGFVLGRLDPSELPATGFVPPPPTDANEDEDEKDGIVLGRFDPPERPAMGFVPTPPPDEDDKNGIVLGRLDPSGLPATGFVPPPPTDADEDEDTNVGSLNPSELPAPDFVPPPPSDDDADEEKRVAALSFGISGPPLPSDLQYVKIPGQAAPDEDGEDGIVLGRLDPSGLPAMGFVPPPPTDADEDDKDGIVLGRLDPSGLPAMGFVPPPPTDEIGRASGRERV